MLFIVFVLYLNCIVYSNEEHTFVYFFKVFQCSGFLALLNRPVTSPLSGENVKEFFFRVASLAFETNVLAELEKSGTRQIGDVVSEYPDTRKNPNLSHRLQQFFRQLRFLFLQESTALQTIFMLHLRRSSPTAVSKDESRSINAKRTASEWSFSLSPLLLSSWAGRISVVAGGVE